MQEMLKLPSELIFLKTCSAAKSTAEKKMLSFLSPMLSRLSPSVFPPGIPQKPQSMVRHTHPCRSACWREQLRPAATICLRPPPAWPWARHRRLARGQGPQHTVLTWCYAQLWGWPRYSLTTTLWTLAASFIWVSLGFYPSPLLR